MGKKSRGKNVVALMVVIITAMVMTVLAGCQNSAQSGAELSSKDIQDEARTGEIQQKTDSGADAEAQEEPEAQQIPENMQAQSGTQSDMNIAVQSDQEGSGQSDHAGTKEPPAGFELTFASENWGLSFGEDGTQPRGNALPEDLAWYDAYYVGDDSEKVIYLTFDCGYENGNTEPILEALKKHNVKATFFVVGHFLETAPELAKRMVEDGHTVGNHTYHHLDMPTISDRETFQKEMDDVADLFQEITGAELSVYYRPPQGKCNADNLKMAYELGYKTIFWSLAYVDWDQDNQPGHEEAFDKLTTRVHPGAIVLLHNTSSTNGEILDELLGRWEEMGYTFKPLSNLTEG